MSKFRVRYEISDGYVGGSRPQYCYFYADGLEPDISDDALRDAIEMDAETDMTQKITVSVLNLDEVMASVRKWLADAAKEE